MVEVLAVFDCGGSMNIVVIIPGLLWLLLLAATTCRCRSSSSCVQIKQSARNNNNSVVPTKPLLMIMAVLSPSIFPMETMGSTGITERRKKYLSHQDNDAIKVDLSCCVNASHSTWFTEWVI